MLTRIDHIVIAVDNLETAGAQFETAGFTVTPGGSHPTGTHNSLITFKDGSYLELIAVEDPKLAQDHPWFKRMAGKQGFVTFAVGADPLDYELERMSSHGITAIDQRNGARTRPDGVQLQWQSSALQSPAGTAFPFLIQDVTDRNLRVPGGEAAEHKNGVTGTAGLTMVVADLKTSASDYGKVFSAPVAALDHGYEGIQQAWRFFIEQDWIDLIAASDDKSPLAQYHQTFGDTIYQLYLSVDTGPEFPPSRIDIGGLPDLHILTTN